MTGDLDTVWHSEDYRLHHPGPTRGGMFMAPWIGTQSPNDGPGLVLEERNAERRTAFLFTRLYIYHRYTYVCR